MFKSFLANKLRSTNAWSAALFLLAALFLPRTIMITLAIVLFFIPDTVVDNAIGRFAPALKQKLEAWKI